MQKMLSKTRKSDIWVGSEWGTLKEVIIGRADQLAYPVIGKTLANRMGIFNKEDRDKIMVNGSQSFADADPVRFKKIKQEVEDWVKLLETKGIKVHRPRLLTEQELLYKESGVGSLFVKDPLSVVGNIVIEGANRFPMRHKDVFTYRHILNERVAGTDAKWVNIPMPETDMECSEGGQGPFLTGGDIFVMGNNNVLLGYNGIDSNMKGLQWAADLLHSQGWTVHFVEYSPEVMHLDCCLSLPREGLALVCLDAFPYGLPDLIKDWDIVNCTLEEARIDACNGLPLGKGVYAMSSEFKHIGDQLEAKGIEVLYTDMTETNHATGGGMRCSHAALVRED
ncbi:arginine deiminase-related protein [Vibrio sp. ER1A]|uniref:arginine deiminase-related protein n=1 Tax=Vibrio sp. ER1A TaxID=1517681 RepID=UPI0004DD6229|nr:arginine deiminase-related protein [Vibrio sp. ER1A]KFA98553.1 hypothetical protein HW45_14600 [Vibrio sp. ER1A]